MFGGIGVAHSSEPALDQGQACLQPRKPKRGNAKDLGTGFCGLLGEAGGKATTRRRVLPYLAAKQRNARAKARPVLLCPGLALLERRCLGAACSASLALPL